MTEVQVKTILFNLLKAMEYMHQTGLMHRDIKPANILLDSFCKVKLCDFGAARPVPPECGMLSNVIDK